MVSFSQAMVDIRTALQHALQDSVFDGYEFKL